MNLSKINLIVTDMDGTLLNSQGKVSPKFFHIFEELKRKNIKFVAASGRQYYSIVDKLRSIIDDIIVISENGAYVKIKEKEFLTINLLDKDLNRIIRLLRHLKHVEVVVCGKKSAYTESKNEYFLKVSEEYYSNLKSVGDVTKVMEDHFFKIAIYCKNGSEKHIYPYVKHLNTEFQVKVSGDVWVDISPLKATKGYALSKLQTALKISEEETMVFGDYNNDLELFDHASIGVAVKNAHPNIKKVATLITKSNDEQGVELILEKLLIAKSS